MTPHGHTCSEPAALESAGGVYRAQNVSAQCHACAAGREAACDEPGITLALGPQLKVSTAPCPWGEGQFINNMTGWRLGREWLVFLAKASYRRLSNNAHTRN